MQMSALTNWDKMHLDLEKMNKTVRNDLKVNTLKFSKSFLNHATSLLL